MLGLAVAVILLGVVFVALAVVIAALGRRSSLHWALAALLVIRGGENIVQGAAAWTDPTITLFVENALEVHTTVLFLFFATLFAATYTDKRWERAFLPIAVIGAIWVLIEAFPGIAHGADGADGPLSLLAWLLTIPLRIGASFLLLQAAMRSQQATVRETGILLAMGMLVFSAWFIGTNVVTLPLCSLLARQLCTGSTELLTIALWGQTLLGVAAFIAWWAATRRIHAPSARWGLRIAYVGSLLGALPVALGPAAGWVVAVGDILFVAAQPLLLAYGMLRFQILGLDMRVKWTIKQSTLGGIFIGSFVAVSQIAGAWLEDELGSSVIGVVATGFLLLAFSPLKRLAERISRAAVPDAQPVDAMATDDRLEIYTEQLEFAWANGVIDAQERVRLAKLRERLHIDAETAMRLETEVLQASSVNAS